MDNFAHTHRSFRGLGTISRLIVTVFFISALFAAGVLAQDTKLNIKEQPLPERPKNYGTLDVQGTIILRVQFLDFGEIGDVAPLKTLTADLAEKAITAARNIKFEPEMKDGKPVTVSRQIEYSYSWNGGWAVPTKQTEITQTIAEPGKAEEIIEKAVASLGGNSYLQIKTQIGRGKYSALREGAVVSFQTFIDVLVFPDKERTEFKGGGSRTVQTNNGNTGWVFDGEQDLIKVQNEGQIANFKLGIRTSLDNLLRGYWKGDAELSYIGKRAATLGKRNEVVKLTYKDGFAVEFEFAVDDGLPQKALYKRTTSDGEEIKEEDRYAQFVETGGIRSPLIVDRFSGGKQTSRINYESIEFNKPIPDSIFAKPANVKDAKKSWN
ncbi:MAG: energy transducer TonB [Pyrinomonadaceae bacterium]